MLDVWFDHAVRRIADERIRAAMERGEFDGLAGRGEPLPDDDLPFDERWWVRNLVERERADPVRLKRELCARRAQREGDGDDAATASG